MDPFCTHLRDRVRIQKSICWLEMSQISRLGRFSHILCDLSLFQACSIIVASDPVNQLKMFGQCCATEDELATENQKELVLHAWSCSFSCRG